MTSPDPAPFKMTKRTNYEAPGCDYCLGDTGPRWYGHGKAYMIRAYYRDGKRWIPFGWLCTKHNAVVVDDRGSLAVDGSGISSFSGSGA